ncbi:MAG: primosomal protein N', partial [Betaproteobacteria bacterium]|nr:primosomal protein N' [Betaproteobacteria bacterium]
MRAVVRRFPQAAWVQLHSGLAEGPRAAAYLEAQQGEADIIIGTRLAILAPIPRLGLIVVDEEHDPSYKQQEGLRYSARDVALYRARLVGCPIVLGSATPSLETLYNAQQQRLTPLKLTRRAASDAGLPGVGFINLNHEAAPDGLTPSLIEAISDTLKRGEQALLYINRRGYAPALVCNQCGWIPECRRCSARLVYHKRAASLKCHHCGYQAAPPAHCGDCGSPDLRPAGQGTERIETALQQALPQARMARVDRDATSRRGSAERIFAATAAGELDLLIGTQMISKGHDFPRLTLVGVINADGAVFSADFRASERLAAQMMQVAGRAGRAQLPGRVLIQTRFPEHPLYQAVAAQNYRQFADLLLQERQVAHLPPYSFLVLLRAEAKGLEPLKTFLTEATQQAQAAAAEYGINIWDPVPAPLARKAGYERWQLLLQADSRAAMQRFLRAWLPLLQAQKMPQVRWVIDVDPIEV